MYIDGITLADLQVFGGPDRQGGLLSLFVHTHSEAGLARLRQHVRSPLSDVEELEDVQAAVKYFAATWKGPVSAVGYLDDFQKYLNSRVEMCEHRPLIGDVVEGIRLRITAGDVCGELSQGVRAAVRMIAASRSLAEKLLEGNPPLRLKSLAESVLHECRALHDIRPGSSIVATIRVDRMLRGRHLTQLSALAESLAEIDLLWTMGATTKRHQWVFPELIHADRFMAEGTGLRHPCLAEAVPSDLSIGVEDPVMFLTGPNMAGKTTYLRSVGLAVLLGQLGMGVPARKFRLAPATVLLTSLNPTDNLQEGVSYYYAEVLRVREAACHAAGGQKCLMIFDEIFKGTNVKDAFEASHLVISQFARSRRTGAIFASHLVELAEPLAEAGGVTLSCFEGSLDDGGPRFSYQLNSGACSQRFGLTLLDKAGVPELLKRIGSPEQTS